MGVNTVSVVISKTNAMRYTFCVVLFLCLSSPQAQSQTDSLYFAVYHGTKKVGSLLAIRSIADKRTVFKINSQVDVDLLFSLSVTEQIVNVFENGVLHSAKQARKVNDSDRSTKITKRNGNGYQLFHGDDEEGSIDMAIKTSVASIYFNEPVSVREIYSENHQRMIPVTSLGPHVYELDLPNSDSTVFEYKNGSLQLVTANTFWGTVHFKKEKLN